MAKIYCPNSSDRKGWHELEFSHVTPSGMDWFNCDACLETFLYNPDGTRTNESEFAPNWSDQVEGREEEIAALDLPVSRKVRRGQPNAISADNIRLIRKRHADGINHNIIAADLGISRSAVSNIVAGRRGADVV